MVRDRGSTSKARRGSGQLTAINRRATGRQEGSPPNAVVHSGHKERVPNPCKYETEARSACGAAAGLQGWHACLPLPCPLARNLLRNTTRVASTLFCPSYVLYCTRIPQHSPHSLATCADGRRHPGGVGCGRAHAADPRAHPAGQAGGTAAAAVGAPTAVASAVSRSRGAS